MKTQCFQTNEIQHCLGKESAWEAGWGRERVALVKSFIMQDRKRRAWGVVAKFKLKMSADKGTLKNHDFGKKLMKVKMGPRPFLWYWHWITSCHCTKLSILHKNWKKYVFEVSVFVGSVTLLLFPLIIFEYNFRHCYWRFNYVSLKIECQTQFGGW